MCIVLLLPQPGMRARTRCRARWPRQRGLRQLCTEFTGSEGAIRTLAFPVWAATLRKFPVELVRNELSKVPIRGVPLVPAGAKTAGSSWAVIHLADPRTNPRVPSEDPLMWVSRLVTRLNSVWLKLTYPFDGIGRCVSIHHTCEVRRSHAHRIRIEDSVLLDREVWLNVPIISPDSSPAIVIGRGTNVGRRSTISARNQIRIEANVLTAPSVFITDHNHQYSDPRLPISDQGVSSGGRVVIEQNCWLGYGSMILADKCDVIIGRNSVVGAYSVVTRSCPPHSVLVGNPAKIVKRYDPSCDEWVRA